MIKDRRKFERIQLKLEIELTLYDVEKEEHLVDPVTGFLSNISRGGGVLELTEVMKQGKHLFFVPLESSNNVKYSIVFNLIQDEETESIELLAEPVWLNRNIENEDGSFLIGIKFSEKLNREMIANLKGNGIRQ